MGNCEECGNGMENGNGKTCPLYNHDGNGDPENYFRPNKISKISLF